MPNLPNTPLPNTYAHLRCIPVPMQALVEACLTPSQWVCLYLTHYKLWDEMSGYLNGPDSPHGFEREQMRDLMDRFYLIHEQTSGDHHRESALNMRASERFTDLLVTVKPAWTPTGLLTPLSQPLMLPSKASVYFNGTAFTPAPVQALPAQSAATLEGLDAFDELFKAYPSHISVDGKLMSGRGGNYDLMAGQYAELLTRKGTPSHAAILELVAWAKENSSLNMGLQKFLNSREWLGLAELRDSGHQGSTYYDASESI